MPLNIPAALDEFRTQQTKRLAKCWQITRKDGVVLRFTNHDTQLVVDGVVYSPAGGFSPSAHRLEGSLRDHSATLAGMISSDRLKLEDLMGGVYEEAEIVELLVDWRYAFLGALSRRTYWIDQVTKIDGETVELAISGPTRFLRSQAGEILTRTCRNRLGVVDPITGKGCSAAVATSSGTVAGVHDGLRRMIFTASSGFAAAAAPFEDGEIRWLTGANAGHVSEVQRYTGNVREFVLYEPTPFAIAPGDTFDAARGCDRLFSTCRDTFSNVVEFRGDPFIQGTDGALVTPR